jgi:hypothetical protein
MFAFDASLEWLNGLIIKSNAFHALYILTLTSSIFMHLMSSCVIGSLSHHQITSPLTTFTWQIFVISFSAAIAEMLVQSTMKDLYLLPALPRDKWANGSVKGLKARGGLTVSISWTEGDLHQVGLWSQDQNALRRLHYRGKTMTTNLSSGRVYTFNKQLKCLNSYDR